MILRLLSPLLLLGLLQADIAKAKVDGYDIPAVPPIPAPLGCKSTSYVPSCFASPPPPFLFDSKQEMRNRGVMRILSSTRKSDLLHMKKREKKEPIQK